MSKASLANDSGVFTWDFYETDREESWMRALVEYTLRPWKYTFGFEN
ncbi:MAG: hypothetical protein JW891_16160 [Candidatus Lokiarchaeota archaeon]|nr:hypothetical protein [Candidatus Lokiarchaeota archaeon]